ncbi:MAG: hypothetical protein ACYTFI_28920 [Planctomycetota bacterium]
MHTLCALFLVLVTIFGFAEAAKAAQLELTFTQDAVDLNHYTVDAILIGPGDLAALDFFIENNAGATWDFTGTPWGLFSIVSDDGARLRTLADRDGTGGSALDVNFDGGIADFGGCLLEPGKPCAAFGSDLLDIPVNVTIVNGSGARLQATKDSSQLIDNDGDGKVDPGDTLRYTVIVTNSSDEDAPNVAFEDVPDANTKLVTGSVAASQGNVIGGNSPGDSLVEVEVGALPIGASATVVFDVLIDDPLPSDVLEVVNQGTVFFGTFSTSTDDPTTLALKDPTVTEVVNTPLERCQDSLVECTAHLEECLSIPPAPDEDGDGEADSTDQCPGTPPGKEVDSNGENLTANGGGRGRNFYRSFLACLRSDWQNDEPLSNRPGDCRFDGAALRCVANERV